MSTRKQHLSRFVGLTLAAATVATHSGCESLPGDERSQGAVIGGLAGAGAGALIGGEDNRLLGALIGGAAGAGSGYLIGANWDKITGRNERDAREAIRRSREEPVSAADARDARTADVNRDGFVTFDEIVAMERAGLSDREMIDRLDETNQYFELTRAQERDLRDAGVSQPVLTAMREMGPDDISRDERDKVLGRPSARVDE